MSEPLVLILDAGTTNIKAALVTSGLEIIWQQKVTNNKSHPQPNWVEQDPDFIAKTANDLIRAGVEAARQPILAMGIANQRESIVIWNAQTGNALYPVISWEDRRTKMFCEKLARDEATAQVVREKTGLEINAYFSASKINWLLRNLNLSKKSLKNSVVGTIDSWLIYQLTGRHLTDFTNASRTLLYNIHTHQWDDELLKIFAVPKEILPKVHPSFADFGKLHDFPQLTIKAVVGDQQASLYAAGHSEGTVKVTYGTGIFPMSITGSTFKTLPNYSTTLAIGEGNKPVFALEGKVENAAGRTTPVLDRPNELTKVVKELARETAPVLQPLLGSTQTVVVDGGISQNPHLRSEQAKLSKVKIKQLPHYDGTTLGVAKLLFANV